MAARRKADRPGNPSNLYHTKCMANVDSVGRERVVRGEGVGRLEAFGGRGGGGNDNAPPTSPKGKEWRADPSGGEPRGGGRGGGGQDAEEAEEGAGAEVEAGAGAAATPSRGYAPVVRGGKREG